VTEQKSFALDAFCSVTEFSLRPSIPMLTGQFHRLLA